MSTSDAARAGGGVKALLWILAALAAALGGYLVVVGANPLWTLAAGLSAGALIGAARQREEGPR